MTALTGQPAYRRVTDDLRQKITDGELLAGTQLPTVVQLQATYGVSSTVIKTAITQLKAENLIVGQQGKGIFVRQRYRIFLSTPMAALDADDYEADRAAAQAIFKQLCEIAPPVYWAAAQIASPDRFEAPDIAAERNLTALTTANAFVYLQLRELTRPTSSLVEVGIALATRKPVTMFAPSEDSLPYTLRRFEAISEQVGFGRFRFYSIRSADDAARLLSIHGPDLLGLSPRPTAHTQRSEDMR